MTYPKPDCVGLGHRRDWAAIYDILTSMGKMPHWGLKKLLVARGIRISENSVARRLREVGGVIAGYGYKVKWEYAVNSKGKTTHTTLYSIQKDDAA